MCVHADTNTHEIYIQTGHHTPYHTPYSGSFIAKFCFRLDISVTVIIIIVVVVVAAVAAFVRSLARLSILFFSLHFSHMCMFFASPNPLQKLILREFSSRIHYIYCDANIYTYIPCVRCLVIRTNTLVTKRCYVNVFRKFAVNDNDKDDDDVDHISHSYVCICMYKNLNI